MSDDSEKVKNAADGNEGSAEEAHIADTYEQSRTTDNDTHGALTNKRSSISSVRAHYPLDEADRAKEEDERQGEGEGTSNDDQSRRKNEEEDNEKGVQHRQSRGIDRGEGAPSCLLDFRDRVEACSHRVQAWSDEQELKARQRQARIREQSDGGVRIDSEGRVMEAKGDNIVQRKGIVVLVFVILTWVYIAYVWRICANGIRREQNATASRQEGIGLLIGFNIFWLLTIWSYVKVVITKPGFVRDHYYISEPPKELEYERTHLYPQVNASQQLPAPAPALSPAIAAVPQSVEAPKHAPTPFGPSQQLPAPAPTLLSASAATPQSVEAPKHAQPDKDILPPPPAVRADVAASGSVDSKLAAFLGPIGVGMIATANEAADLREDDRAETQDEQIQNGQPLATNPPEQVSAPVQSSTLPAPMRLPLTDFPLHPSNTYCYRCKRVKPPRAHHCRHCGTCVLKMDHHCPWVGGCVGARNHKFFYNFLFSVTLLELFVLITNAIMFRRGIRRLGTPQRWTVDGYMISLFPISAMFFLFTSALLITHTYMFVMNLSTIEHMSYERQKTRENILIERWLEEQSKQAGRPKPGFLQQVRERNKVKSEWAAFWGSPKSEANLWWLDGRRSTRLMDKNGEVEGDSKHAPRLLPGETDESVTRSIAWWQAAGTNWREAMGDSIVGWFLPVGRARNAHGLTFEANWRFGRWGEWTTRQQWPLRLQRPSDTQQLSEA